MVGDDLDLDRAIELLSNALNEISMERTTVSFENITIARDIITGVRNKMHPDPFHNDPDEYVKLGTVANALEMQTQYVSHYLYGIGGKPNFSSEIRWISHSNYHAIAIHKDDVSILVARIEQDRRW